MKVVLVVPANAPGSYRLEDKLPFAIENLAVGYLASYLAERGVDWRIIDGYAHRLQPEELVDQIGAALDDDDILAFTVLQSTVEEVRFVCEEIRRRGFSGPIVLGGWAATMATQELMHYVPQANYAMPGESEAVFPELVEAIRTAQPVGSVPGAVWMEGDALRFNPVRPGPIPFDRPRLPVHYGYQPIVRPPFTKAPLPVQASRGCFWGRCTFCSTAARYGPKAWRFRSPESLLQEITPILQAGPGSRVFFVDDEFFGPTEDGFRRGREFAELILSSGLQFEFGLDCLLSDFDHDLFDLLRRAGLRKVFLGVDAGTSRSLKTFKKPYPVDRIVRTVSAFQALEIETIFGFILFEPYMTLADVRENVHFLAHKLDYCGDPGKYLSKLDPESGTELWQRVASDALLTGEFPNWGFRFVDPRVERLYRRLEGPVRELQTRYRAVEEVHRAVAGREIREEFLDCFEHEYVHSSADSP